MISWLKRNIKILQLKKKIRSEESLGWLVNLTWRGLNLISPKLDLTKIIFFISDWTEHPNFWKTHNYFPMFNLTWAESHLQSSCASRVQWNSQNYHISQDFAKFSENPHEIRKKLSMEGTPIWLQRFLFPIVQDTLPKFVNSDGFGASQKDLLKRTETQDLTNNEIRYRVTNKDTLHDLYHHIMIKGLKDSVWTRAFITVVYCA